MGNACVGVCLYIANRTRDCETFDMCSDNQSYAQFFTVNTSETVNNVKLHIRNKTRAQLQA